MSQSRATLFVSIVVGLTLPCCSSKRERTSLDPTASAYIAAVARGEFATAAGLFHYPEDEHGQERRDDEAGIAAGIRAFDSCFGKPRDAEPGYTGIVYEIGFGGGDLAHWRQHPNTKSVDISVTFTKLGHGKLHFDLIPVDGRKWEIRQVKYGLPLYDPRTKMRVARCGGQLAAAMRE